MIAQRLEFLSAEASEARLTPVVFIALVDLVQKGIKDPLNPTEEEQNEFMLVVRRLYEPMPLSQAVALIATIAKAAASAPVKIKPVPGVYCVAKGQSHQEVWAEVNGSNGEYICWHDPPHRTPF